MNGDVDFLTNPEALLQMTALFFFCLNDVLLHFGKDLLGVSIGTGTHLHCDLGSDMTLKGSHLYILVHFQMNISVV